MSGAAIARLVDIISASWMCQAAYAAAELGLPDLLDGASRSLDDLARTTRCDRASLFRLLRALAALDICIENADGSFAVTEMGGLLEPGPSVRFAHGRYGRATINGRSGV